ncbi:MAG: hypothetical protein LBU34_11765 [Planctomycetaceae bacterium]|nr:hypothetical protein [Planctomycetaceae bacterium]
MFTHLAINNSQGRQLFAEGLSPMIASASADSELPTVNFCHVGYFGCLSASDRGVKTFRRKTALNC